MPVVGLSMLRDDEFAACGLEWILCKFLGGVYMYTIDGLFVTQDRNKVMACTGMSRGAA